MLKLIITGAVLYASTALDLLVILMLLFSKYRSAKHRRQIFVGQFIGSYTLIGISLFFAFILHYVPAKWLLGLLGIVPIYFAIKYLFGESDETTEAKQTLAERRDKNLVWTIILITVSSCGADNIGLFVPYFVSLPGSQLAITLVVFTICIFILVALGDAFSQVPVVKRFLGRFGNWIMALIYAYLGIMIIVEGGTIPHLLNLLL